MSNTTAGPLTTTGQHGPFTQSINIYGLEILGLGAIGGQPKVQGEFLKKVAQTYKLLLDENAIGIDKSARARALDGISSYNVIQRVGVESYDSYYPILDSGAYPGWDYINDNNNATDFIWHLRGIDGSYSPSGSEQATEVLEHALHTLSQYALPAAFPEELNVYSQNGTYDGITGELINAYEEAVSNGIYDPSDYAERNDSSDSYGQLLLREYLYCLIYAEWGYIQALTKDKSLSPEWSDSHLTAASIARDNPRGHRLYKENISKVISKPSLDDISSIYQDGDTGLSGYTSGANLANPSDPDSVTGIESEVDTANPSNLDSVTEIESEVDTANPSDPDSVTGIESEVSGAMNKVHIKAPKKYKNKYVNKIRNFNPSADALEIDNNNFNIDDSPTFAGGKNKKTVKKKLSKQDFDFLYDEKKGGLYFNENGAEKGFGDGGIVAILKGAPDLTASNLEFI